MKLFRFYSIRSRITFFTLTSIILLLAGRTYFLIQTQINGIETQIESSMSQKLAVGASSIKGALWDLNLENMNDILAMFLEDSDVVKIQVLDENKKMIIEKMKATNFNSSDMIFTKYRQLFYNNKPIGYLYITMTKEFLYLKLEQTILSEVMFAFFEAILLGIVIWGVSLRTTRPIDKLIHVADSIAKGNLDEEFHQVSNDEVGKLGNALETMQLQIRDHIMAIEQDKNEISALYEETAAINDELEHHIRLVNVSYEETLVTLANAIEANDNYTKGHCERVEKFSLMMAQQLQLDSSMMETLSKAALLHDIGKIGVPSEILNKETPLDSEEFDIIKKHCEIGHQILKEVNFLAQSVPIILQHHERYDGLGYPSGLAGEQINLLARIISVADSFDAMTTSRAYRKVPLSFEQAKTELIKGKSSQFDPNVVDVFLACVQATCVQMECVQHERV